jgi:hypothetical protein
MKTPKSIVFLRVFPSLRNGGSVEQPDATPFCCGLLAFAQQRANEMLHPAAALAQALE